MGRLAARILRNEHGGAAAEYAALVALIAVVAVTGVKLTDHSLDRLATELATKRMESAIDVASEPAEAPIYTGSIKGGDR